LQEPQEIEGDWISGNLPKRTVKQSIVFGSTRDVNMESAMSISPPEKGSEPFEKIA
jgi:hypothetical protein